MVDAIGLFFQLLYEIGYMFNLILFYIFLFLFISSLFLKYINPILTLFIAFTRYSALADLTQINTMIKNLKRTKYYVLLGIAVFALILYIPFMVIIKVEASENNTYSSSIDIRIDESIISWRFAMNFHLAVYSILCILLTVVSMLMLRILYRARQNRLTLNSSCSHNNTKTASYVIIAITICSVVTMCFIFNTALHVNHLLDFLTNKVKEPMYLLNDSLYRLNNIVNIFIHSLSKKFRENLKHILFPCRRICKRTQSEEAHLQLQEN